MKLELDEFISYIYPSKSTQMPTAFLQHERQS